MRATHRVAKVLPYTILSRLRCGARVERNRTAAAFDYRRSST
jgi:hypothetical protein